MGLLEELKRIPLFQGLSSTQREELSRFVRQRKYERGATLFSEGQEADGFYAVISGQVKIFKVSPEGKEQILHIFGPGEVFGEVPVFIGGCYPASADAMKASRVLFFPRADFTRYVARDPSLALNMLAVLSRRLHQFTRLIEDLSLKEVPGRLAAYLIYLSGREESDRVQLDISKAQLASLLGTTPETLSRILGRMSQQGFIRVDKHRIELLDRESIESLAAGEKLSA